MLRASGIKAGYADISVLRGVDLVANQGEIVAIVGSNGAGKSTLLAVLAGALPSTGRVEFKSVDISSLSVARRVEMGLVLVPEGHRVFPRMSVLENLLVSALTPRARAGRKASLDRVMALFPVLADRRNQMAGTLSGGEQQMLAIAQGLMCMPDLLMLDEVSLGLAPKMVEPIYETVRRMQEDGITLIIVEQNVQLALEVAGRAYVLENGVVALHGESEKLLHSDAIRRAYLGL